MHEEWHPFADRSLRMVVSILSESAGTAPATKKAARKAAFIGSVLRLTAATAQRGARTIII
jgi:hypothetical protein